MKKIKYLLLILNNPLLYRYWHGKKKDKKYCDYSRNCGYFFDPYWAFISENPIIWKPKMQSGKIGIYELVNFTRYQDPNDMIETSSWNLVGYENCKPIKDCNFKEFLEIYIYTKKQDYERKN